MDCVETTNLTITLPFTMTVTHLVAPASETFFHCLRSSVERRRASYSKDSSGARTLTNDSQGEKYLGNFSHGSFIIRKAL